MWATGVDGRGDVTSLNSDEGLPHFQGTQIVKAKQGKSNM
jgi:hypothetical protein